MSLFPRTDPGLRDLIAYVVARSRGRGVTLTRTKLVKLLYLMDVERVRARRNPLTGLTWVFFHYGPYAYALIDTLEDMERTVLTARPFHESVLYWAVSEPPDAGGWPAPTKAMADRVIDRFGGMDTNEVLDYVYFHTGPMRKAVRGEPLDLNAAHEDPPEHHHHPLPAPDRPSDIEDRLASWRKQTAARLVLLAPGKGGDMFDDPADDLRPDTAVAGRLHVPDGSEV